MARLFASASSQSMQNLTGIVPGEPLTVSCWVKETTQVVGVIFWLGDKDVTNERYQLYLGAGSGNKLACFAQDAGASGESVTTAATTAGVWQHCAGVWASETSRTAYLNGVAATTNTTAISPSNMDAVALGYNKGSVAAYLDAAVAEVAVWRAILDVAELSALAKGVSPALIRPATRIAHWSLYGNDSPEPDAWRNGYALTLTNGPTKADHPRIYMPAGWVPTQYRSHASLAATASIEFTASAALSTTVALAATAEITFTARGHLERASWLEPTPFISVDGVLRGTDRPVEGAFVLNDEVNVVQEMEHAANRCSFTAVGFEPRVGSRVFVVLGDIDNPEREFIGSVINVTQLQRNESGLIRFAVNCVDDTWKLSFTRVIGETFLSQSWTTTLLALLAKYAPWVDTSGIEDGMDAIEEISFENGTSLESAITQGCKRIGVDWDMDGPRLLCGSELDPIEPAWLTPMSFEGVAPDALSVQRDGSQIVTRVIFECGGSTALVDVQPGEIVLPVLTIPLYDEDGGEVISVKNRIRYTSIDQGTMGTIVGTGALPSAAPDATATVGTELSPGTRDYAITFVTASGETLIGPRVSVSVGLEVPVSPPSTALTPTLTAGAGVDVGSHTYAATFVDSLGNETTSSPVSVPVTTWPHISDPGALPSFTYGIGSGGALTVGNTYKWKITYFNATTGGETMPSGESAAFTVTDTSYTRAFIPLTAFAAVPTGYTRRWYRQENGAGAFERCTDFLIVVIGGVTYFSDGQSQASLEADAPTSNTTLRMQVSLTGIAIGPAGVTSRKVYRTPVGSSQLKLLATIANNTATTLIDNTPDVNLGADISSSSGTTTGRVELSDIPIGAADVTSRNVYRTAAGGSTLKLLTTLADNATSSLLDSTADGSLGVGEPPLVDSSGLAQPQGQVVAGSSTIPVAGTAAFRHDGGWVSIGDQLVRYAGKTSAALTGIPTSGPGSIIGTISYNASVTTTPALIGIPASGPGSITTLIPKGQDVNMLVTVNSTVGQAALAEAFGEGTFDPNVFDSNVFDTEGDGSAGVVEEYVQDRRLTVEEATARAMAILAQRELPSISLSYQTRDRKTKAGRKLTAMLPTPTNVEGEFKITRVNISGFSPTLHPLRQALASNQSLASFENLLRSVRHANRAQNV